MTRNVDGPACTEDLIESKQTWALQADLKEENVIAWEMCSNDNWRALDGAIW